MILDLECPQGVPCLLMAIPSPGSSGSFSAASLAEDTQQVKGLVFETIRLYVPERYGRDKWQRILYLLPQRTVNVLEQAEISEWYPESELRRFLHVAFELLTDDDEQKFAELVRSVAHVAIKRFFKMIPSLASGHFVLRNVPTFYKRIRRGTATVHVEKLPDGEVQVHYQDFRYCRDRLYRIMALASCQAAAEAATGKIPEGKIQAWDRSSMVLSFMPDG